MTSVVPLFFYINLFLIPMTEKIIIDWKIHWSSQVWIFHHGRYKAAALKHNDTYQHKSNTMAQITGTAVMLLLLLTVSLFCQDTAAWGKIF